MMLKVLIYANATGVTSSRQIAQKLETNIAFRVLAANNMPHHHTICAFRQRHFQDFRALFAQVVLMAQNSGLIDWGKVAIDGTKVRANASKRKAMSYARMNKAEKRLQSEVDALLAQAQDEDEVDDALFGEEVRGDELPPALSTRAGRKAALDAMEAERKRASKAIGSKKQGVDTTQPTEAVDSSPSSPALPTDTTDLFVEVPADSSVEEEIARRRKKLANIRKAKSNLKARQRERDEAKAALYPYRDLV